MKKKIIDYKGHIVTLEEYKHQYGFKEMPCYKVTVLGVCGRHVQSLVKLQAPLKVWKMVISNSIKAFEDNPVSEVV